MAKVAEHATLDLVSEAMKVLRSARATAETEYDATGDATAFDIAIVAAEARFTNSTIYAAQSFCNALDN